MGTLSKHLLLGCWLVSTVCLVSGFGLAGRWEVILIFLAAAFLCYFFRRQMGEWFPSVMLVLYLLVACAGLLIELAPAWMIVGVTAALGSWDLAQFYPRVGNGGRPDLAIHLERRHLEYLSFSLSLGLLLALVGSFLRLQAPFGLIVLIVLLVLGSLDRFYRLINR